MKDKNGKTLKAGDRVQWKDRGGDTEGIVVSDGQKRPKLVIVPVVIDPATVCKAD